MALPTHANRAHSDKATCDLGRCNVREAADAVAVHIAQQLVRGELQLSGAAISRLIENCLAVAGNRKPLVIRVHPQDLEMFRKLRGEDGDDLPFKEDPSFTPGSVRVEFDDGWIDDRMEERVDEVSKALQVSSACAPSSACNGS